MRGVAMRSAVVLALALPLAPALAAQAPDHTRYANRDWMYAVVLPGKVRLVTGRPPTPNHGFAVDLSRHARLWVDAGSTDGESLAETVDEQSRAWRGQGCAELQRSDVRLGGRPAVQLLLRCPGKGAGARGARDEARLQRLVIALAAPPGGNNTAYTVGVAYREHGPAAEADRATRLFEAARDGFGFIGEEGSPPLG